MAMNVWDERYAGEAYHFGTEPNAFLAAQKYLLKSGMSCLALADGEGRNGVWLAQQGLQVLAVDASPAAHRKPRIFTPSRYCAPRSPTWTSCICTNMTTSSKKVRGTAACPP
jgi:hypothetical protein